MNRFGDIETSFKRLPPVYGYRSEKLVSLEKALELVKSQIHELVYYIKIAKKSCRFPSEHGLSKDQSAAVYIYTMEWGETSLYRLLNKALRSEYREGLKIWFPYLKLLDTALDKLPTVKEVVWRGVPFDIGKDFTKNQLVTWWSVNSCSSSVNVIKKFLGNKRNITLFLIEAKNGRKISGYTEYESEDEIILRMGTEFFVKSDVFQHSDSLVVHLIEVNDDDDDDVETMELPVAEKNVISKPLNSDASISIQTSLINIPLNTTWNKSGQTVTGQNPALSSPRGLYVDDEQTVYVADYLNHFIVAWKSGATNGQIVAGGNGKGNGTHQLNCPTGVIVDKQRNNLIICDWGNNRVVRWPLQNGTSGEVIISNISCWDLTMDENGFLYVVDLKNHEVRRYQIGESKGIIVAGGNGRGDHLDQLDHPTYIFVDQEHSVFVADNENHRVMKWIKDAKEGIIVAGGQGHGNNLSQLYHPNGVLVDRMGTVYVADTNNHRIVRWSKGSKQGNVIVNGNDKGLQASNQLNYPIGLSFDRYDNLYVVDRDNTRVQQFTTVTS